MICGASASAGGPDKTVGAVLFGLIWGWNGSRGLSVANTDKNAFAGAAATFAGVCAAAAVDVFLAGVPAALFAGAAGFPQAAPNKTAVKTAANIGAERSIKDVELRRMFRFGF